MTASPLETLRDIELRAAEDQLQIARARMEVVRAFIHDDTVDLEPRRALAVRMGVPAPTAPKTRTEVH